MNNREKLTQSMVRELFIYNKNTGIVTNRVNRAPNALAGREAGYLSRDGYRYIRIKGKKYSTHRIIWMMIYGYFPEHDVDHKNGIKDANWLSNLREVSRTCNMQNAGAMTNNTSGYRGVSYHKQAGKWRSYSCINGKRIHLGLFTSKEAAARARVEWEESCQDWNCDLRQEGRGFG